MSADHDSIRRAAAAIPGIPRDADGPVFCEPWEAQAFAITVALEGRSVFTWGEWAETLGAEIKAAQHACERLADKFDAAVVVVGGDAALGDVETVLEPDPEFAK